MLILIALLYFCLACSLIWLAFFPTGRTVLVQALMAIGSRALRRQRFWQSRAARTGSLARRAIGRAWKWIWRHPRSASAVIVAVALPSLLALLAGPGASLPAEDSPASPPDPHLAALLQGELLAPPVPLPPLAFSTAEVLMERPLLVDASRNWGLLHADFSQRLLLAFKIMKERHGYDMALLEGYRSPARQDILASMGRQVSNARAFQSYHQYGLAADCAFWRDGKLLISEKDPWAMRGYRLYGEVAESLGLTWGGRWRMQDYGHTELRLRGVLQK